MKIKRILSTVSAIAVLSVSMPTLAMSTYTFDYGLQRGKNYFNRGMYNEAVDEFQWFADSNWWDLNNGQRQYLLDYLNSSKSKAAEARAYASSMSQTDFDNGMRNGINYFNKQLFYEAVDEFQWFCDSNWGRMNDGQKEYALGYLDGAKAKLSEYVTVYKYANGYVNSERIHKSRISEFAALGWSTSRPATKFETDFASLSNMATVYFKEWLYFPSSATIYQASVAETWDDWDNGLLYAVVYIDARALTPYGYYTRDSYQVSVRFNKYTGQYTECGIHLRQYLATGSDNE